MGWQTEKQNPYKMIEKHHLLIQIQQKRGMMQSKKSISCFLPEDKYLNCI